MILDPDYCRAYTQARIVAWQYGWAIAFHGSGTRDLDLVMVPWTDEAAPAEGVVRRIANVTKTEISPSSPGDKPHGRKAWTLLFPEFGDVRWIDLSVMPFIPKPKPVATCPTCGVDRLKVACPGTIHPCGFIATASSTEPSAGKTQGEQGC